MRLATRDVAVGHLAQLVEVGLDGGVLELPAGALVGERDGLDGLLGRMEHDAAGVGLLVLGDDGLLAGLEIERGQGAGVAVAAVDQVQHVAGLVEADRAGGQGVGHRDLQELVPAVLAVRLEVEPCRRRA